MKTTTVSLTQVQFGPIKAIVEEIQNAHGQKFLELEWKLISYINAIQKLNLQNTFRTDMTSVKSIKITLRLGGSLSFHNLACQITLVERDEE